MPPGNGPSRQSRGLVITGEAGKRGGLPEDAPAFPSNISQDRLGLGLASPSQGAAETDDSTQISKCTRVCFSMSTHIFRGSLVCCRDAPSLLK